MENTYVSISMEVRGTLNAEATSTVGHLSAWHKCVGKMTREFNAICEKELGVRVSVTGKEISYVQHPVDEYGAYRSTVYMEFTGVARTVKPVERITE